MNENTGHEDQNSSFLNVSQNMATPDELLGVFKEEYTKVCGLFKNTKRNQVLREQIFKYLMSAIMTDDERAEYMGLPEGCRMRENAKIISPEKFVCGKHVWIGEGAVLDASGGLEVGDHTSIGLNVMVWSHSSYLTNIKLANEIGSSLIKRKSTKIGNGCFISGPAVIYPGVTIGDRTIILPMSAITESFEGNCMLGGAPAKKIRDL